jgi:PAS domain S-box-containing protein
LLARYGLALGLLGLATLLTALIGPLLEPTPFLLMLAAVMAAAWYGGPWPGLMAALLAAVAVQTLFPQPPPPQDSLIALRHFAVFLLTTLLIGWQSSARRQAEDRLRFLAEASNRLASSLDYQTTLDNITRLTVPFLADACLIDLVEEDGSLRTAAAAHADPGKQDGLRLLSLPSPRGGGAGRGVPAVIQSGRPQLYPGLSEALLATLAKDPDQAQLLRGLGLKSLLILPLVVQGRTLGAVSLLATRGRRFPPTDLDLAIDLANRVALAVDNARLYRTVHEAVRHKDEWLALLDTLLANAPVGMAFLDPQFRYVRINAFLAAINGVPAEKSIGRTIADVLPNLAPLVMPLYRRVLETGQPIRDMELSGETPASAGPRHWLVSYYPVSVAGGPPLGIGVVVADITERKRLEEALRQRAEELAEADRHKDEFLAILSHELRSPLAPLRHALQVMRLRGSDRRNASNWARDMIERQVQHIVRLVDDLLDVSRITRGKMRLHKEEVELAAVINQAVQSCRPLMETRSHHFTATLPDQPVYLEADPTRLEQVVTNLLNNAAKYTHAGGQVTLTVERTGTEVELRVKDTGVGIPPEMLTRIFEPFTQAERSLEHSQGGLGIGLTLVRRLVELHGGCVTAHSAGPGQGSEFVIRLPALSRRPVSAVEEVRPAVLAPVSVPPRRVLVVDDNTDTAESLAMLLGIWGHEVRVVHDGPTSLEAAQAEPPQVVLLDIGLPEMSGYEVAQRLRSLPGLERTLVVALTGYGQEEDRQRSRAAGIHLHLTKPVDLDELRRVLASLPGGAGDS